MTHEKMFRLFFFTVDNQLESGKKIIMFSIYIFVITFVARRLCSYSHVMSAQIYQVSMMFLSTDSSCWTRNAHTRCFWNCLSSKPLNGSIWHFYLLWHTRGIVIEFSWVLINNSWEMNKCFTNIGPHAWIADTSRSRNKWQLSITNFVVSVPAKTAQLTSIGWNPNESNGTFSMPGLSHFQYTN